MLRKSLWGLTAVLAATSTGLAQSAYGIKLPIRGAEETVAGPGEVKPPVVDEPTGIDNVQGKTIDLAAAAAAKQLAKPVAARGPSKLRRIEGVSFFEDAQGNVGLMATGVGTYSSDYPNPDAVRMERRSAYVEAHADAMRMLTEKLYGATLQQKLAIVKKVTKSIDEFSTSSQNDRSMEETINSKLSGLIRGAQVWKCADEGANVRVWLFINNESAKACQVVDGEHKLASAASYQAAVDSVIDECANGFAPPIGGRCVVAPESGLITFVGFGSAIILEEDGGETDALKASLLRAKAGLVAIMTGSEVSATEGLAAQEARSIKTHKNFGKSLPPADGALKSIPEKVATIRGGKAMKEEVAMATQGRLPAGTQDVSFVDDETGWVTSVYIFTLGSDALIGALRGDAGAAQESKPGDDAPSQPAKPPTYDPTKRGPTGEGKDPRGGKK